MPDSLTATGLVFPSTSTSTSPSFSSPSSIPPLPLPALQEKRKEEAGTRKGHFDFAVGRIESKGEGNNGSMNQRTRDLLGGGGGGGGVSGREIDLEVALPPPLLSFSGWERRLDMKSGKVFYGTANSADSCAQNLNFPPTASAEGRGKEMEKEEEERGSLEEHDFMRRDGEGNDALPRESESESCEWQSVCTLDKVKMALERAEKQSGKQRRKGGEGEDEDEEEEERGSFPSASSLLAAGCPRCLLYVLLPKSDPKCPRCSCSILDLTSSPAKRSRLSHTEANGNHESDTASPPFLFDLNSPV